MTANLSKYNFLLQDNTNNFVINSNKGDYNFDYLFTKYENKKERNIQAEISRPTNILNIRVNKNTNNNSSTPIKDLMRLITDGYEANSIEQFNKLFTEEKAKQILTNAAFTKLYQERQIFSRNFGTFIDKSPDANKVFMKTYSELDETQKQVYKGLYAVLTEYGSNSAK